jgi:hypothetical protein
MRIAQSQLHVHGIQFVPERFVQRHFRVGLQAMDVVGADAEVLAACAAFYEAIGVKIRVP